jgi:hypothetical protein
MWVLAHAWEGDAIEVLPSPDLVVADAGQLRAALRAKAAGRPYDFTLRPFAEDASQPLREQIGLFLGGPWGAVSRSWRTPYGWSYLTARPETATAPGEVLFETGGEGVLLGPDALLPAAEVIDAAVYFVERGELSLALAWVGWDHRPPDGRPEPCAIPRGGRSVTDAEPGAADVTLNVNLRHRDDGV